MFYWVCFELRLLAFTQALYFGTYTLIKYFHFMTLYNSTPLNFRGQIKILHKNTQYNYKMQHIV